MEGIAAFVGVVAGIGCCLIPAILGLGWLVTTTMALFDDRPPLV
jgi:hypothetical protein